MEVELRTYLQVWFGIRAPDWEDFEDDEEWEDRVFTENKTRKRKNLSIRKSDFRHDF